MTTTPPPELLELSERATHGVWDACINADGPHGVSHSIWIGDCYKVHLADVGPSEKSDEETEANADFIASLVNWFRNQNWTPKPELPESVVTDDWTEGVKFAVREMAKHPVAFCTDKMVEITAKLIVDAAVKEKQNRAAESVRAANARAEGLEDRLNFLIEQSAQVQQFNGDANGYRINWPDLGCWQAEWYPTAYAAIDAAQAVRSEASEGEGNV